MLTAGNHALIVNVCFFAWLPNDELKKSIVWYFWSEMYSFNFEIQIYAEVVTLVAGSLEAVGLPGSLESEINLLKTWQSFVALYFTKIMKTQGFKINTNILLIFNFAREKNGTSVQVEGWRASPS